MRFIRRGTTSLVLLRCLQSSSSILPSLVTGYVPRSIDRRGGLRRTPDALVSDDDIDHTSSTISDGGGSSFQDLLSDTPAPFSGTAPLVMKSSPSPLAPAPPRLSFSEQSETIFQKDVPTPEPFQRTDSEIEIAQRESELAEMVRDGGGSPFNAEISVVSNGEKVVSVADLHGDYAQSVKALQLAGVLGEDQRTWNLGKGIFVQAGDVVDRGRHSREIFEPTRSR